MIVDRSLNHIRRDSFVAGYFAAVNAVLKGTLRPRETSTAEVERMAREAAEKSYELAFARVTKGDA